MITSRSSLQEILAFMGIHDVIPTVKAGDFRIVPSNKIKFTNDYYRYEVERIIARSSRSIYIIINDGDIYTSIRYDGYGFISVDILKSGKLHNKDGPSCVKFGNNCNVESISYHKDGKAHRFNGPAFVGFSTFDTLIKEVYYVNGKMHNRIGPAYRTRSGLGCSWNNKFALNGEIIPLEVFLDRFEKNQE